MAESSLKARVENIVTIGKNAINPFRNKPWFLCICSQSFENTVGNGEIARNKQFLLFLQRFLLIWRTFCSARQI